MVQMYSKVALLSQIKPGKMLRVTHRGEDVLLANVDGTIYAVDNMCSHEDASLYNGALKGHCVECPLHGSLFDLRSGKPQAEPATESISTYPIRIEGEAVMLGDKES